MDRRRFVLGVFTTLSLLGSQHLYAADSANDQLKLTTDRVVVFKDGYYLAVKSGVAVTNKDGELHLLDVPDNAVLGSVWATSAKGKLVAMVASRDTIKQTEEKSVPCTQMIEILQANIGQKAKVQTADKTTLHGEIVRVLTVPTSSAIDPVLSGLLGTGADDGSIAYALVSRSARSSGSTTTTATVSGVSGSQFILRTDEGDVLLQAAQVQSLTIKDMKSTTAKVVTTTSNPKRLTLRFAEPNKQVDVSFLYFQSGLRWIPTYRINLLNGAEKKMAEMDLQAEFLNEAEDLDNVPVDIVVGVPNFRFKDTPSPLILEQALRNVLQQAAPQLMGQQMSNTAFSVRSGERFNQAANDAPAFVLPPELGATGAQDLFVYNLKKVKLMKGQRAAMSLISAQVPYRDVYTWDVHLTRNDFDTVAPGTRTSPQAIAENRVWHQIVLSNTTKVPWTTGAVLMMQGPQPLAQDLLTYTSPGSDVQIPITVSVDTQGTYLEEETERKLNALAIDGANYTRIDKMATMKLVNRKSIPVDVEITFRTGGKGDEASHDGKITLNSHSAADWTDYRGHQAVNNSTRVVWRATVKPGETFLPTAKYHYFARH